MTRIETETADKLGMTVKAAAVVNYPGWFQHEAIKRQFRGPRAIPCDPWWRALAGSRGRPAKPPWQPRASPSWAFSP